VGNKPTQLGINGILFYGHANKSHLIRKVIISSKADLSNAPTSRNLSPTFDERFTVPTNSERNTVYANYNNLKEMGNYDILLYKFNVTSL
jgi:hypothetical protein